MKGLHYIVRFIAGLLSRVRNVWFRALGVRLQGYIWMRRISIPRNWSDITLEAGVSLDDGVTLLCSGPSQPGKIIIRSNTYVNRYTMLDAHQSIEIGPDVMIGPHCYITDADHGTAREVIVKKQPMKSASVVIGQGAWLGAGVHVLKGVHIGKGAIIGAGSVVTQDVPDFHMAVGVPARSIGERS